MGIDAIAPPHPQEIVERTALLDAEMGTDMYGSVTPPIAGECADCALYDSEAWV